MQFHCTGQHLMEKIMVEICLNRHRILVKRWTPERVTYVGSATIGSASLKLFALLLLLTLSVIAASGNAQTVSFTSKQVSAGGSHTCALTISGGVKCWGNNSFGQLGDGTLTNRSVAADVTGLNAGIDRVVAAGGPHACALTSAGGVKCWGYNLNGQLGDGTTTDRNRAVDVVGLSAGVANIVGGAYHTCVLTTPGAVKCWGINSNGQLGDGTTTQRTAPVDVTGLSSGVLKIATTGFHTCALTSVGGVKCWGGNGNGGLGDGTTTSRSTPTDVIGLGAGVISIAAGANTTCAVLANGGTKCWGDNAYGAVGDGSTTQRNGPVDVLGLPLSPIGVVAASQTCALTNSGGVKCWGNNSRGQVGDNTTVDRAAPVDVAGLSSGVAAITAGGHTCALTTGGAIKCWGWNAFGQLGDSTTTQRNAPVDVSGSLASTVVPPSNTQPQILGSLNLDGGASRAILIRSVDGQLKAGRFNGSQFVFTTIADPGLNFRIVGAVALNNGGKSDLVFQDITQGEFGDVLVWRGFNPATQFKLRQVKRVWDVQAIGDLDGDGFGDLVWRYTVSASPDTGVSYIWFTDGTAVTKVRKRGGAPLDWTLLGAADLNADGAADMVYVSPTNQIRVLMGTANRTCANLSGGTVPAGFTALKFGDFTGSGRGDVLIRNNATGAVQLLLLNASGLTLPPYTGAPDDQNASCTASTLVVSNLSRTLPATATTAQLYTVGDLNGDGIVDIVWVQADGSLVVWLMQPNGAAPQVISGAGAAPFFTPVTSPPPPVSGGTCVGFFYTTGTTYDNRGTATQTAGGAAISASDSRTTVIGPGVYKGQSVIIVETRGLTNGQLTPNSGYSRAYYDDRGTTIGVIAAESFNADGSVSGTTTYSPVDYQPKTTSVGATTSGSYKATTVATAGGFTTTSIADYSYTGSITGTETVTVPAGTFNNACVGTVSVTLVTTISIPVFGDVTTTCSGSAKSWISPVGAVKGQSIQTSCSGNATGGIPNVPTTTVSELIAYSIK